MKPLQFNWFIREPDAMEKQFKIPVCPTLCIGKVGIRFNPHAVKIAFEVQGRMTYSPPISTLAEADAYVAGLKDKLAAVTTMKQLLKVTA